MKNKRIIFLIIIIIAIVLLSFLWLTSRNEKNSLSKKICDYSWERQTDVDTETIYFGCDNSFSYFYGVGDPVEDADLCETYSYDGTNIKLNCEDYGYDDSIKINSYDKQQLELIINSEKRVFTKVK